MSKLVYKKGMILHQARLFWIASLQQKYPMMVRLGKMIWPMQFAIGQAAMEDGQWPINKQMNMITGTEWTLSS